MLDQDRWAKSKRKVGGGNISFNSPKSAHVQKLSSLRSVHVFSSTGIPP
jgi:hypothetical protein